MIVLFNRTGSINAFAQFITKHIRSARTIQSSSILISFALFIDDYLSILTTGFIMTPLTDRFGISRQKLAFLVHSLAGPVVILAPISSWVGAITMYMSEAGINANVHGAIHILDDPFFLYLKTIPFVFYSFLIIASIWYIVQYNVSYGPMHGYEKKQKQTTPDTFISQSSSNAHLSDLFAPILILIASTFIGLLYHGGYNLFGGKASFIQAIQQTTDLNLVLLLASLIAFISGIALSLIRKTVKIKEILSICQEGVQLMYSAVIMLLLTSIFGAMLKDNVLTGDYLASTLLACIPISLLPVMFFITTLIITLATGGAWAAIAISLPIAIPMLISLMQFTASTPASAIPILAPLLGAIFSGAVCGDNISPICGATIMTASSTGVTATEHAYTQFFYSLPALLCTALAFIMSGFLAHNYSPWVSALCPLIVSFILCITILRLINKNK